MFQVDIENFDAILSRVYLHYERSRTIIPAAHTFCFRLPTSRIELPHRSVSTRSEHCNTVKLVAFVSFRVRNEYPLEQPLWPVTWSVIYRLYSRTGEYNRVAPVFHIVLTYLYDTHVWSLITSCFREDRSVHSSQIRQGNFEYGCSNGTVTLDHLIFFFLE